MRLFVFNSALFMFVFNLANAEITVQNNEYTNVFIALNKDIPVSQCEEIVNNLQTVMKDASALLFDMTEERLNFGDAIEVVVPASYDSCGPWPVGNASTTGRQFYTAPIRIGSTHPLFGDNPWTQQPRQCGDPGDFIYLTPTGLQDASLAARELVGEWAKYRWGVMGEVGHTNDAVYPPGYLPITGGQSYQPTSCSDEPLTFDQSECTSEQECSPDLSDNTLPTSSILSLPQLPNVVSLCNDLTHVADAPTKQNLLCSGASAWEIFMRHSDYNEISNSFAAPPTVTVTVVREAIVKASVVIVIENTVDMSEYLHQTYFLLDALCQTISYYLEDGVSVGVLHFSDDATLLNAPVLLNSESKTELCEELYSMLDPSGTSASRNIKTALQMASDMLTDGGSILLVAAPSPAVPTEDVTEAAAAAGDASVHPLVYLAPADTDNTWFESLSYLTGAAGAVNSVQLRESGNELLSIVRQDLSRNIMDILGSCQPQQLSLLSSTGCTTSDGGTPTCALSMTYDNSSLSSNGATYPSGFLVSVYAATQPGVTIKANSSDCEEIIVPIISFPSSRTLLCSWLAEDIVVDVEINVMSSNVYGEIVAVYGFDEDNYSGLKIWTSDSMRNLQYSNVSAPVVFAQVYMSGQPIVSADIAAEIDQQTSLLNITLNDDGTGADVTGQDGIYSAYLAGFQLNSTTSNTTRVTEFDGEISLHISASGPGYFMPDKLDNSTEGVPNKCCGSSLTLPTTLQTTGDFSYSRSVYPRITTPPPDNLPPSRITDLRGSSSSGDLLLSFTAPGADMDQGTVSGYTVESTETNNSTELTDVSRNLVEPGMSQTLTITTSFISCDVWLIHTVTAYDDSQLHGELSNSVRFFLPCSGDDTSLTAGAIVGITLGSILLLILICLILYICCNWKRRDELPVWKFLTCSSCGKKEKKAPVPTPRQSLSGNVQRISTIADLSGIPSKTSVQNQKSLDKHGLENDGYNNNNDGGGDVIDHSTRRSDSAASFPSTSDRDGYDRTQYDLQGSTLQTSLPINKIGIPVEEDHIEMRTAKPGYLDDDTVSNANEAPPTYYSHSPGGSSRHTPVIYGSGSSSPAGMYGKNSNPATSTLDSSQYKNDNYQSQYQSGSRTTSPNTLAQARLNTQV